MTVDIIMINYNNLDFSRMTIVSLFKNTEYPFRLIIVDNASTEEGTKEYFDSVKEKYPNTIVHYCQWETSGFAESNNIGLKYSNSEYVLLLNNDIIFTDSKWLENMVNCMIENNASIVSPKLLYPNGTIQFAGGTFDQQLQWLHIGRFESKSKYSVTREVPAVTFACVLIKRELLGEGLDEGYWIGQFEDLDFCCRVRSRGHKIFYCADVSVYHYESATILKKIPSLLNEVANRNARRFYERWGTWLSADKGTKPSLYEVRE
jgi:GT2 family glycosyltransferase